MLTTRWIISKISKTVETQVLVASMACGSVGGLVVLFFFWVYMSNVGAASMAEVLEGTVMVSVRVNVVVM